MGTKDTAFFFNNNSFSSISRKYQKGSNYKAEMLFLQSSDFFLSFPLYWERNTTQDNDLGGWEINPDEC